MVFFDPSAAHIVSCLPCGTFHVRLCAVLYKHVDPLALPFLGPGPCCNLQVNLSSKLSLDCLNLSVLCAVCVCCNSLLLFFESWAASGLVVDLLLQGREG